MAANHNMHDYEMRKPLLNTVCALLSNQLEEALADIEHIDRLSFRVKEVPSFLKKAKRYDYPLSDIEDQIAGRVLVFYVPDVAIVGEVAMSIWNVVEESHKEPEQDAEFGYESWHKLFIIPEHLKPGDWRTLDPMPTTFEIQIRTLFMHAYAEPQHDLGYKSLGELTRDDRRQLAWIASAAWGADRAYSELVARRNGAAS